MKYTVHEAILSYMKLSENRKQVGYPQLHEAASMSWYQLFQKTRESIVRKWIDVSKGFLTYPRSLEALLGVYVVDSCGDLAPLYEDNAKNIIEKPKSKCTCTQCDIEACLCPVIQDTVVQTDVVIDAETYTNKTVTRVLKNGDIVEETQSWVPRYKRNGTLDGVTEVSHQTLKGQVALLPCGCPENCEVNAAVLSKCGCMTDCTVPYMRERYPALYNGVGYYKKDDERQGVVLFDSDGKKSRLKQVLLVYQSDGSDILVPAYAKAAFIALLDWTRKMYSPSFDANDRREAKRNYSREKLDMIRFLNPIPWELTVQEGEYFGNLPDRGKAYRGAHSDFVQPEIRTVVVGSATPAANITNISYGVDKLPKDPLKEIVDGGEDGSPVSGSATYQDDRLIGLGTKSKDRVAIVIDTQQMVNWGQAKSFDFDKVLGQITFLNGYTFQPLSSLEIDLNQ